MGLRFDQLPSAITVTSADIVPVMQGGVTRQVPLSNIAAPVIGAVLTASTNPPNTADLLPIVQTNLARQTTLGALFTQLLGFLQSGTGAVARTVQAKERDIVSVKDFGAVGDGVTDDTAAIQAAVNAAITASLEMILLPAGTYKISSEISITTPVILIGQGAKRTVIRQTGAAVNGLNFNFAALVQGGGVQNLSVEAGAGWLTGGFQGSGSTGTGIKVTNSNGKFYAYNYGVHNFDTAVSVLGSWYTQWSHMEHLYSTTAALNINDSGGAASGGNAFQSGKFSNSGFTGINSASAGIALISSSGDFFDAIDATVFNNGVLIQPTTGKSVLYPFFTSVLADTSVSDSWLIDATNGKITSVQCVGCWGAFSTNGAGLTTKTSGTNLNSVRWIGGRLRENGTQGWNHTGGLNVELIGVEIASNSKLTANTYDGVLIAANINSWGIENCRIGNYASSLTGHANNINITAGTSATFRVIGNDLNNPGAGKVAFANGSSSADYMIADNLPTQVAGLNASNIQFLSSGSVSSPGAGTTNYIGPAGATTAVAAAPFSVRRGVISGFRVNVTAAPGGGQTFTYTVVQNSVDSAMTGTISGAASFTVSVTSNAFLTAAGDEIVLKLVTSGGAAVTTHRIYIQWEP